MKKVLYLARCKYDNKKLFTVNGVLGEKVSDGSLKVYSDTLKINHHLYCQHIKHPKKEPLTEQDIIWYVKTGDKFTAILSKASN